MRSNQAWNCFMAFCISSGERRPSSSLAPRQITRNSGAVLCVVIGSFEACGFYFVQFNDERNGVIRTLVSAAVFTLNKAWLDPLKPTERKQRRAVVASTVLNFFFALAVFLRCSDLSRPCSFAPAKAAQLR